MAKFAHGDKVTVSIPETGTIVWVGRSKYDVEFENGHTVEYVHESMINRAEPANWPPQAGDVWEAAGKLYGVRKHSFADSSVIYRVDAEGEVYSAEYGDSRRKLEAFLALK